MINVSDLKNKIIIPVISELNMYSPSAVNLLLGTAAQESLMGKYLKQINGPALSLYGIEPVTYNDMWDNFLAFRPELARKVINMSGTLGKPSPEHMIENVKLATAMARIKYYRVPEPLPCFSNIPALAQYWKTYYNTPQGKGTCEEFINNYNHYVGSV